jgi:hypothetical protein
VVHSFAWSCHRAPRLERHSARRVPCLPASSSSGGCSTRTRSQAIGGELIWPQAQHLSVHPGSATIYSSASQNASRGRGCSAWSAASSPSAQIEKRFRRGIRVQVHTCDVRYWLVLRVCTRARVSSFAFLFLHLRRGLGSAASSTSPKHVNGERLGAGGRTGYRWKELDETSEEPQKNREEPEKPI